MPLTKLNSASVIDRLPTGSVLQVKSFSQSNSASSSPNTDYGWDDIIAPSTSIISLRENSGWVVTGQWLMASRSSAVSCDIWYKIGASGTWASFGSHGTSGGASTGSYGLGTAWDTGSTDLWSGNAHHANTTITASIGSALYFKGVFRRGGPGTDTESSGSNVANHDKTNSYLTVMEIKG